MFGVLIRVVFVLLAYAVDLCSLLYIAILFASFWFGLFV